MYKNSTDFSAAHPLAEQDAARAVEYLAKAQAAGFFQVFPGALEHMQKGSDLDAIRKHPRYLQVVNTAEAEK